MENLHIEKMTPILKQEICLWDRFSTTNNKGYKNITRFVAGKNGLAGYFQMHEYNLQFKAPDTEDYRYVLKNENGKILGFVCFLLKYTKTDNPTMYIQSIVIHPGIQNKGYGKTLIKEIINNPSVFMSKIPAKIEAYIDPANKNSKKFFESLGAKLEFEENKYFEKYVIYKKPEEKQ